MRILSFLWAFFACITITAQPPDPLPYQIERHIYFARYAEAKQTAEMAVQERSANPQSYAYAVALAELGRVRNTFAKYGLADTLLTEALAIFEKNSQAADSAYLKTCLWAVRNCRDLAKFPRAEALLKKGLAAADACKGSPHEAFRGNLLWEYANWDVDMSRFQQANWHYEQAVAAMEKHYGKKHAKTGQVLTNWANFQNNTEGKYKKAAETLQAALKILEPQAERFPVEYVWALQTQGQLYGWGLARYREATATYQMAIAFAAKHLGKQHPDYAFTLQLAGNHDMYYTPHFHRADTFFRKALAIYEGHFGGDYPNCVGALQDLAGWQNVLGYTALAAQTRQEAGDRCLRIFGDKHPTTAQVFKNLSKDLALKGNAQQAQDLLNAAEQIYTVIYGAFHTSKLEVLAVQASREEASRMRQKADSLRQKALKLSEQLYGRGSTSWWGQIYAIALNYSWMDNVAASDSLLNAYTIYNKTTFGMASIPYALSILDQYRTLDKKQINAPKEKERLLLQYLSIIEQAIGQDNWWCFLGYNNFCDELIAQKRYDEALKVIDRWEAGIKRTMGEKSAAMVGAIDKKINIIDATRPPAENIPYRQMMIDVLDEIGGEAWQYVLSTSSFARELSDMGRFVDAKTWVEKSKTRGKQMGETAPTYFLALLKGAVVYGNTGEFKLAKADLDEAYKICVAWGKPKDVYAAYMTTLFNHYTDTEQYEKAEALIKEQIQLTGENEPGNCNQYGRLLIDMEQYQEAEKWLRKGIEEAQKRNMLDMSEALYNNLALALASLDRYPEALDLMGQSLKMARQKLDTLHPEYARALYNYAGILESMGRLHEAQRLYQQGLDIIAKAAGTSSMSYHSNLNNLSINLMALGHFQEAADSMTRVMDYYGQKLGTDHASFVFYRQNLADIYIMMGKYREADSLVTANLMFWEKNAPNSLKQANALNSKATLSRQTGQLQEALQYANRALEIQKSIFPHENNRMTYAIGEMALTYARQKNFKEALRMERWAMSIDSATFGTNHLYYAVRLHNLGRYYHHLNRPDLAEPLVLQSMEIRKKIYQTDTHPNIGFNWSVLAGVYQQKGDLAKAENAARAGLKILLGGFGPQDQDYGILSSKLGRILLAQGDKKEGAKWLAEGQKNAFDFLKRGQTYMSSAEQRKMFEDFKQDVVPVAALEHRMPELAGLCYNYALVFKGAALRSSLTLREALYQSKDTAQLRLLDRFLAIQQSIAAEYRLKPQERKQLESLEASAQQAERELVAGSPQYRAFTAQFEANWQAVQYKLQPGEAAIEFVRFNRLRIVETDTFMYAAVVVLPGGKAPVFVPLCAENSLDALQNNKDRNAPSVYALYQPQSLARSGLYNPGTNLYRHIWQPIDSVLQGVKRIYFAPDGLLHRVSFASLGYKESDGNETRLLDKYELVQLSTTRKLLERTVVPPTYTKDVLVVGDIDYGKTDKSTQSRGGSDLFDPLDAPVGQKSEYVNTCEQFRQKKYAVTGLSGAAATEAAVLGQLASKKRYRVISLVTHGIFLPSPDTNLQKRLAYLYSEANPMQRSGLVFAGVNKANTSANYASDGLMMAQDFAGLDLKGTELVVLPACQSGLGDVKGSEGVFGLQRAFREAGARYLIISLWDLPNDYTGQFMEIFYNEWLVAGKSIPTAFRKAQQAIKKKNGDTVNWGGLILIE